MIWDAPCENVSSGICVQRKPRSDCVSADFHCPLTISLDTTECVNGEQRPGLYFARAQDDLYLLNLRMLEGIIISLMRPRWYLDYYAGRQYVCIRAV